MSKIPQQDLKPASLDWQIVRTVNGNLEWGLNIRSTTPLTLTTPNVANTEFEVVHNLGFVPNGYIVLSKDAYCDIKKGATPWTTSKLYLKCDQATVALVVVVC